MLNTLLRLPAVKGQCGYSRSTIYLRIDESPPPSLNSDFTQEDPIHANAPP